MKTKTIIWVQFAASLFAAIIGIACLFMPITTFRANSNAGVYFLEYLSAAQEYELEKAETPEEIAAVDEKFETYYQNLGLTFDNALEGEEFGYGEVKASTLDIVLNSVNMVKILIGVGRYKLLFAAALEGDSIDASVLEKLEQADFSELNETSLSLAYFFGSYIFDATKEIGEEITGTVSSTLSGSSSLFSITPSQRLLISKILNTIVACILFLVLIGLYISVIVEAVKSLIGILCHLLKPEDHYQQFSKQTASLLIAFLSAMLLGNIVSNGGEIAIGGTLIIVALGIVLAINLVAVYLKKNNGAQIKYLLTSHAIGIVTAGALILATIATTDIGLADWLLGSKASELITEATLQIESLKDSTIFFAKQVLLSSVFSALAKVLSISLLLTTGSAIVSAIMLPEADSPQQKGGFNFRSFFGLVCSVLLPYLLCKFFLGFALPSYMMSNFVLSWVGVAIFIILNACRGIIQDKFAQISFEDKQNLLSGFPDRSAVAAAAVCKKTAQPVCKKEGVEAPIEEITEAPQTEAEAVEESAPTEE